MIPHRCQVCGQRKPVRKDGMIVHHHYKGDRCRGAGALPYDQDDSALQAAYQYWEGVTKQMIERQLDHARRRLNEPLPSWFFPVLARASTEAARLGRRAYRRRWCWKPADREVQVAA